ncbi:MAG: hypothetical protein HZR80_02590 [Candidatus Heimdallarchaeota archaeon]
MTHSSAFQQSVPANSVELDNLDLKITANLLVICELLVINLIKFGQVTYPSVLSLYNQVPEKMSLMTFKQKVKKLTECLIIEKLPRSDTQPLLFDINNNLLHFILIISQPELNIRMQIQNQLAEEPDDSFLQQLTTSRERLEDIIESITNEQETVKELSEEFLNKFPVSIIDESSPESLEIEMVEFIDWFVGEELLSLPEQLEELLRQTRSEVG